MKCVKRTLKVMQCIPEIPSFIYTILFVTSANYLLVKFHKSKSFKQFHLFKIPLKLIISKYYCSKQFL